MNRRLFRRTAAILAATWLCGGAFAQDLRWIEPSAYRAAVGEDVLLHVQTRSPQGAASAAWPGDSVRWFFVRAQGTQDNRDAAAPAGGDTGLRLKLEQPGVTLVGLDLRPFDLRLTAAELREAVTRLRAAERPDELLARAGDHPQRVSHIACMKTLLRSADRRGMSQVATSKTGQRAEIRLLIDATAIEVGSDLPVRLYAGDGKAADAVATAIHDASGTREEFSVDREGIGHFALTHSGAWRIEFHDLQPAAQPAADEWTLYSATLTFEARGGEGRP